MGAEPNGKHQGNQKLVSIFEFWILECFVFKMDGGGECGEMLMEIHDSLMTELSKRVDGQTDIIDICRRTGLCR